MNNKIKLVAMTAGIGMVVILAVNLCGTFADKREAQKNWKPKS
jgi:hypothetical protein